MTYRTIKWLRHYFKSKNDFTDCSLLNGAHQVIEPTCSELWSSFYIYICCRPSSTPIVICPYTHRQAPQQRDICQQAKWHKIEHAESVSQWASNVPSTAVAVPAASNARSTIETALKFRCKLSWAFNTNRLLPNIIMATTFDDETTCALVYTI